MRTFLLLCWCIGIFPLAAQEFNASVTINTIKLTKATPELFQTLETSIEEFYNSNRWTNDEFQPEERIKLQIQINLQEERSDTRFIADFQIQAVRPVYNSEVETVTFVYQDQKVIFDYQQYQPIIFSQNNFQNNLTSLLTFYGYFVLGSDYDTFSERGGQPYFKLAEEVINNIPSNVAAVYKGWRASDGNRNRYWLLENTLSPRMRTWREGMYMYHRLGMDNMYRDSEEARSQLTVALSKVDNALKAYPNAMILPLFALAKRDEIIEIYKAAPADEKKYVRALMIKIDPSNAAVYQQIGF